MSAILSDIIAERYCISSILSGGYSTYVDVCDIVTPLSFTIADNQMAFRCIQKIFERDNTYSLDLVSIIEEAKQLGCKDFYAKKPEREHLQALFNFPVDINNATKFAAKLRRLEIARRARAKIDEIANSIDCLTGEESLDHIISSLECPIFEFTNNILGSDTTEPKNIADGIDEYLDFLENNPRKQMGISSGYSLYDKAIGGGFRRKTVSLIGARLKVGKSQKALNICKFVADKLNVPSLYLDTEMDNYQQLHRLLAMVSGIEINDIETGQYSKSAEWKNKVRRAAKILKEKNLYYINISGKPFSEIISIMRRWMIKIVGKDSNGIVNDAMIVYDYLKLMDDGELKNLQEYQVLGFQMTQLHNFAVKFDVPILSFIQLNRDGINKETTDIASGSDRILWLCSNFSIFKPKSVEEIAQDGVENGNRKLVTLCARHGEGLKDGEYINFNFDGKRCQITELGTNYQLKKKKREFESQCEGETEQQFSEPGDLGSCPI